MTGGPEHSRVGLTVVLALVVLGIAALAFTWGDDLLARPTRSAGGPAGGQPVAASAFAPGACIEYPPTSGNRGVTVFLDAGHGGVDPGALGTTESGQTIEEADETLPVELDAMKLLQARGFTVVVSRVKATNVIRLNSVEESGGVLTLQGAHDDVAARDVCADDAHADVLVGIYFDAGATPENAGSLTAYDPDRPFAAASLRLATLVQDDVLAAMNARGWGIPNDGVQTDAELGSSDGDPADGGLAAEAAAYDHLLLLGPASPGYFSTPSEMPGTVIEPLYITDPFEGSIADSAVGQETIAQGIAAAVEQYFARPAHARAGRAHTHARSS